MKTITTPLQSQAKPARSPKPHRHHRVSRFTRNQNFSLPEKPVSWQAVADFIEIRSAGELRLVDHQFQGGHLWMEHLVCGYQFKAAVEEVMEWTPGELCPFCTPQGPLRRFGNMLNMQLFVIEKTLGNIYVYLDDRRHPLGSLRFFCCIHRGEFEASFSSFLRNKCVCPVCSGNKPRQDFDESSKGGEM